MIDKKKSIVIIINLGFVLPQNRDNSYNLAVAAWYTGPAEINQRLFMYVGFIVCIACFTTQRHVNSVYNKLSINGQFSKKSDKNILQFF